VLYWRIKSEAANPAAAINGRSGDQEVEVVTGVVRSGRRVHHIYGAAPWTPPQGQLHTRVNTLVNQPFSVLFMCPNSSVVFDVAVRVVTRHRSLRYFRSARYRRTTSDVAVWVHPDSALPNCTVIMN